MSNTNYSGRNVARTVLAAVLIVMLIVSTAIPVLGVFSFSKVFAEQNVTVDKLNGGNTYIVNDTLRITPLSESVVRLEEKGAKGFEDRQTFYILGRDEFVAPISNFEKVGEEIVIYTEHYIVHIPATATTLSGCMLPIPTDTHCTVTTDSAFPTPIFRRHTKICVAGICRTIQELFPVNTVTL